PMNAPTCPGEGWRIIRCRAIPAPASSIRLSAQTPRRNSASSISRISAPVTKDMGSREEGFPRINSPDTAPGVGSTAAAIADDAVGNAFGERLAIPGGFHSFALAGVADESPFHKNGRTGSVPDDVVSGELHAP